MWVGRGGDLLKPRGFEGTVGSAVHAHSAWCRNLWRSSRLRCCIGMGPAWVQFLPGATVLLTWRTGPGEVGGLLLRPIGLSVQCSQCRLVCTHSPSPMLGSQISCRKDTSDSAKMYVDHPGLLVLHAQNDCKRR